MQDATENGWLSPELAYLPFEGGLLLSGGFLNNETNILVIDPDQSELTRHLSDGELGSVLQKLLRFAKKIWQGLARNFSERFIPDSNKAILFPMSAYQPTPYRIVIDRKPLQNRMEKRGRDGRFMLVYKANYETGDAQTERATETNIRRLAENYDRAIREFNKFYKESKSELKHAARSALTSETIDDRILAQSLFQTYHQWLRTVTSKQRAFIEAGSNGAARIEGAAGTGKTLSLMLKAIHDLRTADDSNSIFNALFITHSEATRNAISEYLSVIDEIGYLGRDRNQDRVTLRVATLSEICAEQLAAQINPSEFIDRDALESKELQLLYISEAARRTIKEDLSTHERYLSQAFLEFIRSTDEWELTQMLQHEFSVLLKGRAGEKLDIYRRLPPLRYGLPATSEADKGFVYTIFNRYQDSLQLAGQFDTDDVVLTAIGQLETPIWRRRRLREGFDHIYIDETHLFNINELHVFHYFAKDASGFPISYSLDRSQAIGDQGWTTEDIAASIGSNGGGGQRLSTVFRSSPQIVDLAASIVASGATLFTNFDDSLSGSYSGFTDDDERLSEVPVYRSYPNDLAMIEAAFERVEDLQVSLKCKRSEIAAIFFDRNFLKDAVDYAEKHNKGVKRVVRRGDVEALESADNAGQFIVAHADYVGGLEFLGVVLVGVDKGRLPPVQSASGESRNYLSYVSHNRLYVAVSRAKYRVEVLGDAARGPSELLAAGIERDFVQVV